MTRYLKTVALATMAVLALGAVSAAGASAEEPTIGHLTSDGTVTLVGKEDPEGLNTITMFGSELQCPDTVYTGHSTLTQEETEEGVEHGFLHGGETEITVTPHYNAGEGCSEGKVFEMNGCDYRFDDFTTTPEHNADGTYGFTTDIICPPGNEITLEGGTCVVHVPAQTGLTGLHATNENNKIRLSGEVTGITASSCFGLHTENAVWHTDILVEGQNSLGNTTEIRISDAAG